MSLIVKALYKLKYNYSLSKGNHMAVVGTIVMLFVIILFAAGLVYIK